MNETTSEDPRATPQPAIVVPDGFVVVQLEGGKQCIVPEYLVPATHQAFDGYRKRLKMDVRNELGGSGNGLGYGFVVLGDKDIIVPSDPAMTEREIMGLHAEIMALRDRYGISYKDATSRLYMTEWEKVKTDDRAKKAFSVLAKRTRGALSKIQTKLKELDGTSEVKDTEPGASTGRVDS